MCAAAAAKTSQTAAYVLLCASMPDCTCLCSYYLLCSKLKARNMTHLKGGGVR